MNEELFAEYQEKFTCKFPKAVELFPDLLNDAVSKLSPQGVEAYLEGANFLCKIGQGVEPVLVFMEVMPDIASHFGQGTNKMVADYSYLLARSPNKKP